MSFTNGVKMKLLLSVLMCSAVGATLYATKIPCNDWLHFAIYFSIVVLSSGMKIRMPGGDSTISINFPFLLLAIISASPLQALLIAAVTVFVQCTHRKTHFTPEQVIFNVSNTIVATLGAWLVYGPVFRSTGQMAPAVAAATLTYSFINVSLVARMIGWATTQRVRDVLRHGFIETIPYYLFAGFMATAVALVSQKYGWLSGQLMLPVGYACYITASFYMNRQEDKEKHLQEMTAVHMRTIEALTMAIEAKDQNTHDHVARVRVYVAEIGKRMKLSDSEYKALEAGALLHDIGKLAVPEHIITKPGKLTLHEFEKMKIHPQIGAEILERVRFPYPVVPVVRSHHERWDGKGYPDGLAGENIPLTARILTVVDCFDALVSDRPYRPALPIEEAMDYVVKNSGTQFDPAVVTVLKGCYIELEARATAEADKIAPFKTHISVQAGGAPAAGLEVDESGEGADRRATDRRSGEDRPMPEGIPDRRTGQDRRVGPSALSSISAASYEAQILFQLAQTLGSSLSVNETLSVVALKLRRLIPFDTLVMYLKEDETLIPAHICGVGEVAFEQLSVPIGEGLVGWVADSRKPILNGNPEVEPGYASSASQKLRSAIALPLEKRSEDSPISVLGVLALYSVHEDGFARDHLRILQAVIDNISCTLANSLTLLRVTSESNTDYLTGILNPRGFASKAQELLDTDGGSVALISCDVDDFKLINDTQGHQNGDYCLQLVANTLSDCCGSESLLGRLGGDEFAALLAGRTEKEVYALGEKIENTVLDLSDKKIPGCRLGISLGIAFRGKDGTTLAELSEVADGRMYTSKRSKPRFSELPKVVNAR